MNIQHSVISKRYLPILIASTLSTISTYVLMLTDSIIAGNMIGTDAVTAITLISPVISFVLFVCYVLSSGTALDASFYRGKADEWEVNSIFNHGMGISILAGAAMTIVMIVFKDGLLSIWHISKSAAGYADGYYTGLVLLPIAMAINLLFYSIFIEKGIEKVCFVVGGAEAVVNIGLSLILTPRIGIVGISFSSTISMATGALIFFIYYMKVIREKDQVFKRSGFRWSTMREILIVGFNDSMDGFLMILLPGTISFYLIYTFGDEKILLFTVVINALNLLGSFLAGMADTMELLVCLYYGENNLHGVRKIMRMSIKIVVTVSIIVAVGFLIFADYIPLLYGINDPVSRVEAAQALRIFTVYLPFYCIEYIYFEYYGCVGYTVYSIVSLALLIYVLPVSCLAIGGAIFGVNGAWMGIGFGYVVSFALDQLLARKIGKRDGALLKGKLLLRKDDLMQQFFYNIDAGPHNITDVVRKADEDFADAGIPYGTRMKTELFMEEMGMQAVDRQNESSFQIEYTAMFNNEPTLIIRDSGETVDTLQEAENLSNASLRNSMLAQLASSADTNYKPVGEKNRTIFHIGSNNKEK